ncbi:MAG: nickel pincer cofactor biosynthesis protein LarB [Planctomycetales bacterium]|nr:nickel pincer cofactor biosynthesis protein LarB [Planctomycetales bacterium]
MRAMTENRSNRIAPTTLDFDRQRRCGFPEVVFGEGKSTEALAHIFAKLLERGTDVLATRIEAATADVLRAQFEQLAYNPTGRTIRIASATPDSRERQLVGKVSLVSAGTSDLPVVEEARETLDWMGVATVVVHDVGVAGPHRFPERLDELAGSDAIVVVAGMEGALPSVVGGYVDCPVIAVPTSVGYGANLGGIAALLSMLNSCAANVSVVNIDAGFKAAYVAGLIATRRAAGAKR